MGAEQSAPAAGPMSEEEAAAKIQAINRGNKSRREFGSPAAAGGKGNIMMITVTRKKKSAMPDQATIEYYQGQLAKALKAAQAGLGSPSRPYACE